jgi:hypothetical protein
VTRIVSTECVPVAAVAGETRSLDRKHRTDTTVTDCGQQSLEAWTSDAAAQASSLWLGGTIRRSER